MHWMKQILGSKEDQKKYKKEDCPKENRKENFWN
jgi:hypothetical protein